MTATNHEIFKHAHKVARMMKAKWPTDSYAVCFAMALRETYREIREHDAKMAAKAAAEAAERAANTPAANIIADKLVDLGGRRWTKAGKDRVYFNAGCAAKLLGYEFTYYKTGNISSVTRPDGEFISNCAGRRLLGSLDGTYVDLADNSVHSCNDEMVNYLTAQIAA